MEKILVAIDAHNMDKNAVAFACYQPYPYFVIATSMKTLPMKTTSGSAPFILTNK
jgi:hypothetical protein